MKKKEEFVVLCSLRAINYETLARDIVLYTVCGTLRRRGAHDHPNHLWARGFDTRSDRGASIICRCTTLDELHNSS